MKFGILILFALTSLPMFAQGTGHPGGGGPYNPYNDNVFCQELNQNLKSYESEFCKSWSTKYNDTNDFTKLIEHIHMLQIFDFINYVVRQKDQFQCKQIPLLEAKERLSKRKNADQELDILKKYYESLRPEMRKACPSVYSSRGVHLQNVSELIKLYEE